MWPVKVSFLYHHYSSSCESCGWYEGLSLKVTDESGNELLSEYGDTHMSGGPILDQERKIPFLMEEAGYGEGWRIEHDYDGKSELEMISVYKPDDSLFGAYLIGTDFDVVELQVLRSLGHEIEVTEEYTEDSDDDTEYEDY